MSQYLKTIRKLTELPEAEIIDPNAIDICRGEEQENARLMPIILEQAQLLSEIDEMFISVHKTSPIGKWRLKFAEHKKKLERES